MGADTGLPEAFLHRLEQIVGSEVAATVLGSMARPKDVVFWRNSLAGPGAENDPGLQTAAPLGFAEMFRAPAQDRQRITRADAAVQGAIYIQSPASVYAALALGAMPGEEVLDLCAAPGGKSLVLAAAMENQGRLAVVESVKGRFHRLRANLERCGVTIAAPYLKDGRSVGRATPGRFDRVLVDAPCSSEGRFRLDEPATFAQWSPRKIKECARKQRGLLRSAYAALKPGGRLVYCTCTFAPEENERVVAGLLSAESGAGILELPEPPCRWLPGLTRWQGRGLDPRISKARRLLPDSVWDGFFVCAIEKH